MAQALDGAQQWAGVRPRRQVCRALALGFQASRMEARHRGADTILDTVQGVIVEPARQACEQFGECRSQQFQKLRRVDADLADRPRWQYQE